MPKYFIPNGDEEADDRCFEVETLEDGRYRVTLPDGQEQIIDAYAPEPGRLQMLIDGHSFDTDAREKEDGEYTVQLRGETHHVSVLNERQRRMKVAGVGARAVGGPDLVSPMAGKVVAVTCDEGQEVDEGECVVIVEAMKMENDLKAHIPGAISTIHVGEGDAVEIGDVLVSIE
ncbi:MAG: acetyl-CoA carboxylase biotin carboxyl carrier protein subunit [Persicimonas sp.]